MPRASLRDIASTLGVSAMTVSRALRGQPGISNGLRERVRAAAAQMDYRPDPTLNRLMRHLREGRPRGLQAVLCGVTDIPMGDEPDYCTRLHRHAAARACELGFTFSILRATPEGGGWRTLVRSLTARGAEGVLLLPMVAPTPLAPELWNGLSVVAATASVVAPSFCRVIPDHGANARLLVERLTGKGYRRLGFVGTTTHSQRTHDAFPSALALHHTRLGIACSPLVYAPGGRPDIADWARRERPHVVIVGRPSHLPRFQAGLAGLPRPVAWALAGPLASVPSLPGLDERHDLIGAAAVDVLAGLVARGERGPPAIAATVTIPGDWIDRTATLS